MIIKKTIKQTKQPKGMTSKSSVAKKVVAKKVVARKTRKKAPLIEDQAKTASSALNRIEENPIILPSPENNWEAWQVFNPGVILLTDKIHFIYRAIGEDGISRFGYASSNDGCTINERLSYPVYAHQITTSLLNYYSFVSGGSFGGAEDPRLTRVDEEDRIYMTYTACDEGLQMALSSIKISDFFAQRWRWKQPVLISRPGETHKNWVIFPEKINGKYAILHSISPEISIAYRDNLEFERGEYIKSYYNGKNKDQNGWEKWIRGAGAPPLKTDRGWLLFYHAMDGSLDKYKVGAMLLDLNDPTKVIYRSSKPILEPEKDYENNGFKAGVVYISGAVIKDGEVLVYYGASDSYVSMARANLEEFLDKLTKQVEPKLKKIKIIKK